jgi:hypothetical protein
VTFQVRSVRGSVTALTILDQGRCQVLAPAKEAHQRLTRWGARVMLAGDLRLGWETKGFIWKSKSFYWSQ